MSAKPPIVIPPALAQVAARAVATRDVAARRLEVATKQQLEARAAFDAAERHMGEVARAIQLSITHAPQPPASSGQAQLPATTPTPPANGVGADNDVDEDMAAAISGYAMAAGLGGAS